MFKFGNLFAAVSVCTVATWRVSCCKKKPKLLLFPHGVNLRSCDIFFLLEKLSALNKSTNQHTTKVIRQMLRVAFQFYKKESLRAKMYQTCV